MFLEGKEMYAFQIRITFSYLHDFCMHRKCAEILHALETSYIHHD